MCKLWFLSKFLYFCKLIKQIHHTYLYTRTSFKGECNQMNLHYCWLS